MRMQMQELPRKAVGLSLEAARLPLTAYESIARRGKDNREWPPAVAFESAEARIKQIAGALLRDDELVRVGRLQEASVAQLRRAAELETVAEHRRDAADAELQRRQQRADERREQVEETAEQRTQRLERETAEQERRIEQEAAAERERARETEAAVDKSVRRTERAARHTRVREESQALAAERDAHRARGEVLDLDQEIDKSKQARRSS